jgi:asparagine synthase (glutamine-hydrolysing)
MLAVLRHRGPDGWGWYRDEHVALGHTRLSIIDLAGGAQPLCNEDGTRWITFNGEIFNYVELRAVLEQAGHRFRTRSDTEVILHAFEEWGSDAWQRFNGQYAFALWDGPARQLWLVRDLFGILPLFYAQVPGAILFASEVKALFASGRLAPRFHAPALREVFTRWAVPAPQTVFAGVQCVVPGSALSFDAQLRPRTFQHARLNFAVDPELSEITPQEAGERLGSSLREAVSMRLRADVPVGAYLSGGLDSSVITALIHEQQTSTFKTFAIRFSDPAFDETEPQRRMARQLGTNHHEIVCDSDAITAGLADVIWHCETPLLRTAPVPLFHLSRAVRAAGMKVVLTGEGADELLAGYDIFKEDRLRRFWQRQPASTVRPALFARLYADVAPGRSDGAFWRRFFGRDLQRVNERYYSHHLRWENTSWSLRLLAPDIRDESGRRAGDALVDAVMPADWTRWDPLARAQAIEIASFMSPYLLCSQGDRVAMAHGVEVRYPYLDPAVVALCSRLPARVKLRGLHDKVALREFARHRLPEDIALRPKRPYRAPMTRALFAARNGYVADLLAPRNLRQYGLVDPPVAEALVAKARARDGQMSGEREEMALVGLLTLQLLARHFLVEFGQRVTQAAAAPRPTRAAVMVDRLGADRDGRDRFWSRGRAPVYTDRSSC